MIARFFPRVQRRRGRVCRNHHVSILDGSTPAYLLRLWYQFSKQRKPRCRIGLDIGLKVVRSGSVFRACDVTLSRTDPFGLGGKCCCRLNEHTKTCLEATILGLCASDARCAYMNPPGSIPDFKLGYPRQPSECDPSLSPELYVSIPLPEAFSVAFQ